MRVTPDPPEANAFLVTFEGTAAGARRARLEIAQASGVWLFEELVPLPITGLVSFEVTVREGAFALSDGEIRSLVEDLVARARRA